MKAEATNPRDPNSRAHLKESARATDFTATHLEVTLETKLQRKLNANKPRGLAQSSALPKAILDGCKNDPESDMDSIFN